MRWSRIIPVMIAICLLALWQGRTQTQAQVCTAKEPQASLQYLRRLSLDLRGHVPTVAEMQKVTTDKKVSQELIDSLLKSAQFSAQMRRYHKDLLWGNLNNIRFYNVSWSLRGNGTTQPYHISSASRRIRYRGTTKVACLNERATKDAKGEYVVKTEEVTENNGTKTMARREGYVEVKPYWDPTKTVKVCAFDAQTAMTAPRPNSATPYNCQTSASSTKCGCGPNLRWCLYGGIQTKIRDSMVEQSLRFAENIVKSDRPYTDLLTAKDMEVNGILSHWYRHQVYAPGGLLFAREQQNFTVPALPYGYDNWTKVQRGKLHAGVLTLPLFLLKFASNRGRANRFYNAFLCSYFQAPAGGLPAASDSCHNEPNLMKRCGCASCHQTVEPIASFWGRWAEAGLAPLNPDEYQAKSSLCSQHRNRYNGTCRRLYFTQPNHPDEEKYRGMLLAYVFATPQMHQNIEAGPLKLANTHISNGNFALCTTRKIWTWFIGAAPTPQQEDRLIQLAESFKNNNYSLKSLIKEIVTGPEYRQGRLLNR